MSEKVKLTQEQADEVELQKKEFSKLDDIVTRRILTSVINGYHNKTLHNITVDELIKALYIGYEVEPEFKVGDWVVNFHLTIGRINNIDEDWGGYLYEGYWNTGDAEAPMSCYKKNIKRHATPEEIAKEKERRRWRKRGRDVWELKGGDMLYSRTSELLYEVVFELGNGEFNLNEINSNRVVTTGLAELKHDYVVWYLSEDRRDV